MRLKSTVNFNYTYHESIPCIPSNGGRFFATRQDIRSENADMSNEKSSDTLINYIEILGVQSTNNHQSIKIPRQNQRI